MTRGRGRRKAKGLHRITFLRDLDAGPGAGPKEIVAVGPGPDWRCLAPSPARGRRPCYTVNPADVSTCRACGAARP